MKREKIKGISISEFVDSYLDTNHTCFNLKHQGLKSFNNPYVIGVSNDFALKNPDCVARQEIVVVIDDYGHPGTYLNPVNMKKLTELEICKEKIKLLQKLKFHNFNEIASSYKLWIELTEKVKCLQGLYGFNYNLLYYMEKTSVIRDIRRYAKEESKKIIYDVILNSTKEETKELNTDYVFDTAEILIDEGSQEWAIESYKVTEKINRQKQLKCYRKIG